MFVKQTYVVYIRETNKAPFTHSVSHPCVVHRPETHETLGEVWIPQ